MLRIGDIIERTSGRSKYTTGRVTGFSPGGHHARVQVTAGQQRIWPKEELRVTLPAGLAELRRLDEARRELVLRVECEAFVARVGPERTAALLDLIAKHARR